MRVLHTSDWHLGAALHERRRQAEHERFLDWLLDFMREERPDALLVAGDVFDTGSPGNISLQLYYDFIRKALADKLCRKIVVTGGNHDSPSLLDAPSSLLRLLDAHVVGEAADSPAEEVVEIPAADGGLGLLVCAVPFLRERDVRKSVPGETSEDKDRAALAGIKRHYDEVFNEAVRRRTEAGRMLPIVVMGHLFMRGCSKLDGPPEECERDTFVGNLGDVGSDSLPAGSDYTALGHLHAAQTVGGDTAKRYSGSPIPMAFSEAGRKKFVVCVDFHDGGVTPVINPMEVPVFQCLAALRGGADHLVEEITRLASLGAPAWIAATHVADGPPPPDLRRRLDDARGGKPIDILRVVAEWPGRVRTTPAPQEDKPLMEMSPEDVFLSLLDERGEPDERRQQDLLPRFRQILSEALRNRATPDDGGETCAS